MNGVRKEEEHGPDREGNGRADERLEGMEGDWSAGLRHRGTPWSFVTEGVTPRSPERPPRRRPRSGLLERLKKRKIVQWVLAYLALVWMVLQLNDVLGEIWSVPLTMQKAVSLALGLGVLPALVVAWYHGEKGRQRVCCTEVCLLGLLVAGAAATVWYVCFP